MDFITVFDAEVPVEGNPEAYKILLPLGLILVLAKLFSLLLGKIKVPQVIGFLISGLVVGLIFFIPGQMVLTDYTIKGLSFFAKVGVILIMFSAGVETDLKSIKQEGWASIVITSLGVLVPLALGFTAAYVTDSLTGFANHNIYSEIYYGVILSATSVSITVATLKELKKLDTPVGSAIVSAAILDDIIGIVLLSLIISLGAGTAGTQEKTGEDFVSLIMNAYGQENTALEIALILIFMVLFFALSIGVGYVIRRLFNFLGTKYPHHLRITVFSVALCFLWSYVAEYFNIADITGAYLMGLIFSTTKPKDYIDHRAETTSNYIFAPVFFASIALTMYQTDIDFTSSSFQAFLWFGIIWVFVGLLGKVLGAGAGALMFKFKFKDALKIGVGMMARAEVLIVCAQKGVESGLVSQQIMPFTLILILISSFITPILLKALYKDELKAEASLPKPEGTADTALSDEPAGLSDKEAETTEIHLKK
jgi:Kef-type K+ transport system membrane component KefB